MGIQVVRFEKENKEQWGVVANNRILVLRDSYSSLAHFLEEGVEEARTLKELGQGESLSLTEVTILSPVTKPARIVCQGANYSSHRAESGMEATRPPYNMFFSKADSTLCGPYTEIIRPSHVKLLDYEIELGLVIGTEISSSVEVTDENLHLYIAGLVIMDDVSARDVQLTEGQWLKGKSYRTFGPTGPFLYLLDKEEVPLIHDLELNLWVNDELRQSANTNQLLYKPAETLTELSEIMDLSKGDLVITGTTGGVALTLTPEILGQISSHQVPYAEKVDLLVESQINNGKYLNDGDVIRCQIKSRDGKIDLGEQVNKVVPSRVAIS
ncbi:2-keto-4-pentenoate hydratase/2-oxohepta-3-ene-1,7-dioic acid hydratase in catechol pathway [Bacillus niacini]|uniref:2-keto-4-pentenoate hydratase/2-oxohepta-3-ene-1,7-dioic acid hydratase in catechol pathway n=1 Tax=Neobacillus niacini TaxID=86668 RepID=A0A852TGY4_9BACI|nr:fumarylacetoacetate hydrolase family protein [Neobacillus niacini]NYE07429.1 2-keto-4-pentenoate hydratase/2-oxohepta-3-ene-1,7-dioic acid hydratase in catechol pathway [Neobacillus niacini]